MIIVAYPTLLEFNLFLFTALKKINTILWLMDPILLHLWAITEEPPA